MIDQIARQIDKKFNGMTRGEQLVYLKSLGFVFKSKVIRKK